MPRFHYAGSLTMMETVNLDSSTVLDSNFHRGQMSHNCRFDAVVGFATIGASMSLLAKKRGRPVPNAEVATTDASMSSWGAKNDRLVDANVAFATTIVVATVTLAVVESKVTLIPLSIATMQRRA
jgi:dipeptidyl aminopeptidase/acylaminoacyl peptidase